MSDGLDEVPSVVDGGGVRRITFDRPLAANALTLDDLTVVEEALTNLPASVRAVVLRGSGGRFSAGMHLDAFLSTPPDEGRELIERVGRAVAAVRLAPVPTVAVVDGHCLGAAFEMALACDLRVCSTAATFGLPEVLLAIPSVVDAALLVDHVGLGLAKEMILTGGIYPVAEVPGLANVVVAPSGLDAATERMVELLTVPTAEVVAAQKGLFETWLNVGLTDGIEASKQVFADVFALPVTQQALADYAAARRRRS